MTSREESVRSINPAAIARLYWNTTEADVRAAIAGRIVGVDADGMVRIKGHVWERPEDRPPLRPEILARRDQRDAGDQRIVRTTEEAAELTGLSEGTFIAAWMTCALRDADGAPVDLLLNSQSAPLWRVTDIDLVTAMHHDGRLARHIEDWTDRGGEVEVS